jgi:trk system potassium uptake protein TrkA
MKAIISGVGAVGIYLAKMLADISHDITIIDPDEEKIKQAEAHIDLISIRGNSALISTLEEAQAHKADLLISVTNDEEVNILTCILAKKLGVKTVIARIDDPEYLTDFEQGIYKELGIDQMIYPEWIAAREIANILKETSSTETYDFDDGKLSILMIKIDENAPVIDKTFNEIVEDITSLNFRAVAIKRGKETIIPTGMDKVLLNDQIYVIAKKKSLEEIRDKSGVKRFNIENIMIVGGTKIGKRTALELENHFNVKLIEKNRERCNELADILSHTLLICGNGNDMEVLEDEGIAKMDAFIALTDNTEANIFSCLLAKKMGVKRTIALVDNIEYIEMSQNIGIDTIINKKLIAASYIHKFTLNAEVADSKCLSGVDADVMEFLVKPGSKITKKQLKSINFPKGAIIGGVIRGDESIIATGDTKIEPEDHVVVFSVPGVIKKVEKFFN